jgi:ferredoxin
MKYCSLVIFLTLLLTSCKKNEVSQNLSKDEEFRKVLKELNIKITDKYLKDLTSRWVSADELKNQILKVRNHPPDPQKIFEKRKDYALGHSVQNKMNKYNLSSTSPTLTNGADGIFDVFVKDRRWGEKWCRFGFFDEYMLATFRSKGYEYCACSDEAGASLGCVGKLVSGRVDQEKQSILNTDQINAGYIITCVAIPISDVVFDGCYEEHM